MSNVIVLPADMLRRVLADVFTAPKESFARSVRTDLEPLLAKALIGPVALEEFLAALAEVSGAMPTAEPLLLEEGLLAEVIRDGLAALSDELFGSLAVGADAIRSLSARVVQAMLDGSAGKCWLDAFGMPDDAIPAEYLPRDAIDRALAEIAALNARTNGVG